MFEGARGTAVIAVSDLARARSFYEEVFGLTPDDINEEDQSVMYTLGGTPLLVYLSGFAGTAKNTVFAIETQDLDARYGGTARQRRRLPGLRLPWSENDGRGRRTARRTVSLVRR